MLITSRVLRHWCERKMRAAFCGWLSEVRPGPENGADYPPTFLQRPGFMNEMAILDGPNHRVDPDMLPTHATLPGARLGSMTAACVADMHAGAPLSLGARHTSGLAGLVQPPLALVDCPLGSWAHQSISRYPLPPSQGALAPMYPSPRYGAVGPQFGIPIAHSAGTPIAHAAPASGPSKEQQKAVQKALEQQQQDVKQANKMQLAALERAKAERMEHLRMLRNVQAEQAQLRRRC